MNIFFILIEPITPENVGAAARAIKTMGFSKLRLVNPCNHLDKKAKWLAVGSTDILEDAEIFIDFESAIKDIDLIIGTSSKKRKNIYDYYDSNELRDIIGRKQNSLNNVAIVFGSEDNGITNLQLDKCDIVSSIPLNTTYPSLNLAQSVMLYAYSISSFSETIEKEEKERSEYGILKSKVLDFLPKIGIAEEANIYNRIIERMSLLSNDDIHLLLSIISRIDDTINHDKT